MTSEGFEVEPCVLNAAALPGCHIEVPAGIWMLSLVQKGDWVIRLVTGRGAVIGRMLRGALPFDFHSQALAGVQRLGALACCLVVAMGLVGCHSKVQGANFKPSFLSKQLLEMMAGEP